MLIRITAPHFVAGVDTFCFPSAVPMYEEDEYLNECAPIVSYMKRWSSSRIKRYCIEKGWEYYPYSETRSSNIR